MEDYPSPAEGNGLENRQAGKTVQGFESLILLSFKFIPFSSLQRKLQLSRGGAVGSSSGS